MGLPAALVKHDEGMSIEFSLRDDGQVDANLGADWPIFTDALNDAISSLPPRGAKGNGPSTYWIDLAENGLRRAAQTGESQPFISGNATVLRVSGESVVAAYDYAEPGEPGEQLPLSEFIAILAEWRRLVTESARQATQPLPETYRRNPHR